MAGYDTWHSGNVTVWFKVFFEPQNVEQGLPAFGGARGDQGISNHEGGLGKPHFYAGDGFTSSGLIPWS